MEVVMGFIIEAPGGFLIALVGATSIKIPVKNPNGLGSVVREFATSLAGDEPGIALGGSPP
jgi:hypothetical protein